MIALSKMFLSDILARKKMNGTIADADMPEDTPEIQAEDIGQVQELVSSEHELRERVESFLKENGNELKKRYSVDQINDKLVKVAKKAGATVIYPVLLLYNLFRSSDIPSNDKMRIIVPLAYFILPADIIPDIILGLGFVDDSLVIMTCIKAFSSSITPEITEQTRTMCHELVGEFDEDVISSVAHIVEECADSKIMKL